MICPEENMVARLAVVLADHEDERDGLTQAGSADVGEALKRHGELARKLIAVMERPTITQMIMGGDLLDSVQTAWPVLVKAALIERRPNAER